MKIRGSETKYLLRQLLFKHVPKELIERPKQGFSIPIQKWLLSTLQPQLLAMKEDQAFHQKMGLQQDKLCFMIDNFIEQRKYINPHFIWFLYSLHQWYLRWMR
jgi:asparagine synthase (glutamine-hydrolysing)